MNATYSEIWSATYDWLQIAERDGMEIDWESEPLQWDEVQSLAEQVGHNPEDDEMGAAVIVEPRECDTLLQPGDIVLTTGPGGDVYFFRAN